MEEAIRILVVDDEPDIRRICRFDESYFFVLP